MEVKRILNNSALVVESNGNEFVVLGKGIGFNKKIGDIISENIVEKKYKSFDIPIRFYELTRDIVSIAEEEMNIVFDPYIYVSLTDHIYNAIKRKQEKVIVKNNLINEIRVIYKKEYMYALEVIEYIKREFGIDLDEDEAGFIVTHFINASTNQKREYEIIKHLNEIINIINNFFGIKVEENFELYTKLVTNIKYLIINKMDVLDTYNDLEEMYIWFDTKYKELIKLSKIINKYFKKNLKVQLNKSEIVYLLLYIKPFCKLGGKI